MKIDFKDIIIKLLPDVITYNDNEPYLVDLLQKVIAPLLNDIHAHVHNYNSLFNPRTVKPELLKYLARYLGVEYDAIEPYDVIVKKVENAIPFYRKKGLYDSYKIIFNSLNYNVNIYDLYSPVYDNPMLIRGNEYNVPRQACTPPPVYDDSTCQGNTLRQQYGQVYRQNPSYHDKYKIFKRLEDIIRETDVHNLVEFMQQWFKTPHFDIEFTPFTAENEYFRTDYQSFTYTNKKNITLSIPEQNYKVWADDTRTEKMQYTIYTYFNVNEYEQIYISEAIINNAICEAVCYFEDGSSVSFPIIQDHTVFDKYMDFGFGRTYEDVKSIKFVIIPTSDVIGDYLRISGFINVAETFVKNLYPLDISPLTNISMGSFATTSLHIDQELIQYFLKQLHKYRPAHTVPHPILKLPFYDNYYTDDIKETCSSVLNMCNLDRSTLLPSLIFWATDEQYCCYGNAINRSGKPPLGFLNFWKQNHLRDLEVFDNGYKNRALATQNCKVFTQSDEQYLTVPEEQRNAIEEYRDRERYEKNGLPYYPPVFDDNNVSLPEKIDIMMSGVYVNTTTGEQQLYDEILYLNNIIKLDIPFFADDFAHNVNDVNFEYTREVDNRKRRNGLGMKCYRQKGDRLNEFFGNVYGVMGIGWDCLNIKAYPITELASIPTMQVAEYDESTNTIIWHDSGDHLFDEYDQSYYDPIIDIHDIDSFMGMWIPIDTICCGNGDFSFIWDVDSWDGSSVWV